MRTNVYSRLNEEKKFENILKTYLIAKNWWIRKLHGNLYQAGLPDLLVSRHKDGKLILIELKAIKPQLSCLQIDIIEKLEGPQVGTILMLAKKKAPVVIVAGSKSGWFFVSAPFKAKERVYAIPIEDLYDDLNNM